MDFISELESLLPGCADQNAFLRIELTSISDCGVLKITFNQPEIRNPLDLKTADQFSKLCNFCNAWENDLPFGVILLEGSGSAFSAGGDFDFLASRCKVPQRENVATMSAYYDSFLQISSLPVVTIANVHASAIGAGLCLAMACDFVMVHKQAKLGFPFLKLGINPGMAAYPLLRQRVGETRARDLLFSGRYFSGQDFFNWGGAWLAYAEDDEVHNHLGRWIAKYRDSSYYAFSKLRQEIMKHDDREIRSSLPLEAQGQAGCYSGGDFHERLAKTLKQISNKNK